MDLVKKIKEVHSEYKVPYSLSIEESKDNITVILDHRVKFELPKVFISLNHYETLGHLLLCLKSDARFMDLSIKPVNDEFKTELLQNALISLYPVFSALKFRQLSEFLQGKLYMQVISALKKMLSDTLSVYLENIPKENWAPIPSLTSYIALNSLNESKPIFSNGSKIERLPEYVEFLPEGYKRFLLMLKLLVNTKFPSIETLVNAYNLSGFKYKCKINRGNPSQLILEKA